MKLNITPHELAYLNEPAFPRVERTDPEQRGIHWEYNGLTRLEYAVIHMSSVDDWNSVNVIEHAASLLLSTRNIEATKI